MQSNNQVILSLGSNQGDLLKNIQDCILLIHNKIGTVITISKLYKTPSWGFEAPSFYNCALLIHTTYSPEKILRVLLDIESELGRKRSDSTGYESRIIDIDIISYNDEIIDTPDLQIPHPLLQNRRFVMLPLADLRPEWVHPVTGIKIDALIKNTGDDSNCEVIGHLDFPYKKDSLRNCNYISIEGNIGAGKTTLSTRISEDFNAKLVLERFADNSFLPKFYKDPVRFAFPLEVSFLTDRYKQLTDDLSQFDLFKDFVVADYHIFKSLIFAKVTLGEDEYRLYKTMFDIIYKEMPKPDLYIYLYQNSDRLLSNIKKRGRDYEQDIQREYLEKINQGYLEYIKNQTDINMIIIDVSELDFVENQEDYVSILKKIEDKLSNKA
ncbi:MAG: 2-amino-4-hydroxy-6-hydroxymethyldihydropteridine diphosphokinase [Flavobacterium sp.]|nr:2-amino-4-hydroxy-6-hydroxymethyldihydropteridine diphosphokinase [Candidatus Neoflavobacterium equi]